MSCGGHWGANCASCPYHKGNWKGKDWCNGDCGWKTGVGCVKNTGNAEIKFFKDYLIPYLNNYRIACLDLKTSFLICSEML